MKSQWVKGTVHFGNVTFAVSLDKKDVPGFRVGGLLGIRLINSTRTDGAFIVMQVTDATAGDQEIMCTGETYKTEFPLVKDKYSLELISPSEARGIVHASEYKADICWLKGDKREIFISNLNSLKDSEIGYLNKYLLQGKPIITSCKDEQRGEFLEKRGEISYNEKNYYYSVVLGQGGGLRGGRIINLHISTTPIIRDKGVNKGLIAAYDNGRYLQPPSGLNRRIAECLIDQFN
jgi:hypothetical protein